MSVLNPNKPIKIISLNEYHKIVCTSVSIDILNADGIKVKKRFVELNYFDDVILIGTTILVIAGVNKGSKRLIWVNYETAEILKTIDSFNNRFSSLIYDEQRKWLIAFGYDKRAYVFNVLDYELLKTIELNFDFCFPNVVSNLNTIFGYSYFTGTYHGINLNDFSVTHVSNEIEKVEGFNWKYNYVLSIDGKTLNVYDLGQQKLIQSLTFNGPILQIDLSHDCEILFIALIYDEAFFFHAKTFIEISKFNHFNNPINTEIEDLYWPVTFNKNNEGIIIGCHNGDVYEKAVL